MSFDPLPRRRFVNALLAGPAHAPQRARARAEALATVSSAGRLECQEQRVDTAGRDAPSPVRLLESD